MSSPESEVKQQQQVKTIKDILGEMINEIGDTDSSSDVNSSADLDLSQINDAETAESGTSPMMN